MKAEKFLVRKVLIFALQFLAVNHHFALNKAQAVAKQFTIQDICKGYGFGGTIQDRGKFTDTLKQKKQT